jgi:hypothetical protein
VTVRGTNEPAVRTTISRKSPFMIVCRMSWLPELVPRKENCPLVSVAQESAKKVATTKTLDMAFRRACRTRDPRKGCCYSVISVEMRFSSAHVPQPTDRILLSISTSIKRGRNLEPTTGSCTASGGSCPGTGRRSRMSSFRTPGKRDHQEIIIKVQFGKVICSKSNYVAFDL